MSDDTDPSPDPPIPIPVRSAMLRHILRFFLIVLVVLVVLIVAGGIYARSEVRGSLPQVDGTAAIQGLSCQCARRSRCARGADDHRRVARRRRPRAWLRPRAGSILPDGSAAAPTRRRVVAAWSDRARWKSIRRSACIASATSPIARSSWRSRRIAACSMPMRMASMPASSARRAAIRVPRPARHAGAVEPRRLDPHRARDVQHAAGPPGAVRTIARRAARHAARADVPIFVGGRIRMGNAGRWQPARQAADPRSRMFLICASRTGHGSTEARRHLLDLN